MNAQNCIDVKNVFNLSINYLTRFFGAAGKIIHVYKDQNTKYVTIEFAHSYGVDKALRFNGRVLDKEPIKIQKWKENSIHRKLSQDKKSQEKSEAKKETQQKLEQISFQNSKNKQKTFKSHFWSIITAELNSLQPQKPQKQLLSMIVWAMGNQLMIDKRHLQQFKVNTRSNYIYDLLQTKIINIFEMKNNNSRIDTTMLGVNIQARYNNAVVVWLAMSSPNTEEEQSKIQSSSSRQKMISAIKIKHKYLASIFNGLYTASFCLNQIEEQDMMELVGLEFDLETNSDDNYTGIIENVGVTDVFYENQKYAHPNTCIYLQTMASFPEVFNCSMRMVGCEGVQFQEKSWCDIYSASITLEEGQGGKKSYSLNKKMQLQRFSFKDHNLIFECSQFSLENVLKQYRRYEKLSASKSIKLIYVRKKQQNATTTQQPAQLSPIKPPTLTQPDVPLTIIQIRSQNIYSFNQYKLQHYLQNYIDYSIIQKGMIISSKQMAIKLSANIIDREKQSRLFQFANIRYQKYIGEELWRLYQIRNQRKLKNNLTYYKLGKK